ncbi:DUF4280 domain-containing protein [Enterocloster aldenensis]|uniref:DUF4280 domain-containing protein n=1 Tax=Enterocloster aldenensis TaxID=358742 RepID=UPI0025A427B4|nr:DUF4280 domain-containing protein [Enterocloster aldenensis]
MGDSTTKIHWVDYDVLTVEKTVKEKAGDSTKAGSGATLDDHIARANNQMEELEKNAPSARELEAEQEKASKVQGPPTREQDFANRVEQKKEENATEERAGMIAARGENRANQDVARAMMIADEKQAQIDTLNEMSGDSPIYVVHGARMICSMGSREARLVLPMDHGVYLRSHPQMTADDCAELTNIQCFGNCFSMENPKMKEAAIKAVESYNEENPSFWDTVKGWFGIQPKEKEIDPSEEMLAQCICECVPKITAQYWDEINENTRVDGKPTLTQKGVAACSYGGVIKIYVNGQDE